LLLGIPFTVSAGDPVLAHSLQRQRGDSILRLLNGNGTRLLYSNPDSSILYSQQAQARALQLGDSGAEARALTNLGKAYYIKGSYELSLKYSIRGLSLAEKAGDQQIIGQAYNNIGLVYLGHDQYDLALEEFLYAVNIASASKDSSHIAAYLFNAGICFDHRGEFTRALDHFNRALVDDKGQHVALMSINRLGETWLHMKQYDTAARYYRQVLADPRAKEDHWEKAFAWAGLAQIAYLKGQFDSAVAAARLSLDHAGAINAKWDIERAVRILAESYAALHQYRQAYEYMQMDRLYNDSLYSDSREEVINYLKLQEREKENGQLQTQSEKDRKIIQLRTALLAGACLLALLLIGIAFVFYRNDSIKSKLNRKLEYQNGEILATKEQIRLQNEELIATNQLKDQLFSVISHDLRGPMSAIQQMLEFMKTKNMPEEERKKMFDLFYRQVILSNNMLNNLLQWVTTQLSGSGITAKKEVVDPSVIIGEVLSVYTFLAGQKRISMENHLSGGVAIRGDKEHLKIIFQNIIGNAVKFTNPGGTIRLFDTVDNHTVTLHVKDDGVGIPAGKLATLFDSPGPSVSTYGTASEKGTGIGLQLVRQFVEHNDGKISIISAEDEGTETCISFTCTS